jgi:hypothetical protein
MYIRERESGTVGMQCNKLHDDDWFIRRRPQEKKVGLTTWQCLKESTRRAVTRGSDVASMAPRLNKGSFFFLSKNKGRSESDACMSQVPTVRP